MMIDRKIYLMEKYLSGEADTEERKEFERLISYDRDLKEDYEEQKRIKEALNKMQLKNPSREVWDNYWMSVYNKVERGIAWIAISIGAVILIVFAVLEAVQKFMEDTQTPAAVKIGIVFFVAGLLILVFSLIREKLFTHKRDKYKEIQR